MDEDEELEGEAAQAFQAQCFLTHNWRAFQSFNSGRTYPNFVKIAPSGDQNDSANIINRLSATGDVSGILNLDNHLISSLVPRVQFIKSEEGVDTEIAFHTFIDSSNLRVMTETRNALGYGAGIKSFEFTKKGNNPAEFDRMLEATLVIHLSSMAELTPNLSALFEPAPADGPERTIKAIVGWAIPPSLRNLSAQDLSALRRLCSQTREVFVLRIRSPEIDLREDGTVQITCSYIASIDQAISDGSNSGNVLIGPLTTEERVGIGRRATQAARRTRSIEQGACRTRNRARERATGTETEQSESVNEAVQEYRDSDETARQRDAAEQELALNRMIMYRAFLRAAQQEDQIFYIDVDPQDVGIQQGSSNHNSRLTQSEMANRRQTSSSSNLAGQIKSLSGNAAPPSPSSSSAQANRIRRRSIEEADSAVADQRERADDAQRDRGVLGSISDFFTQTLGDPPSEDFEDALEGQIGAPRVEQNKRRIFFMYVGTILNVAMKFKNLPDAPQELKDLRPLVGSTEMLDVRGSNGNVTQVNIADIPITLDLFRKWFLNQFIRRNVDSVSLSGFIQKLNTYLIREAMSPRCVEGGIRDLIPRAGLAIDLIPAPALANGADRATGRTMPNPYGGAVQPSNAIAASSQAALERTPNVQNYLYIYSALRDYSNITPAQESANGIYTLTHGKNRGLVKRITFKKNASPHLRDSAIVSSGARSVLAEPYDADISLIGNALFKPGMLVKVNPTFWRGLSSIPNLKIGGYYAIQEVSSVITPGSFETEIRARWQSSELAQIRTPRTEEQEEQDCEDNQ